LKGTSKPDLHSKKTTALGDRKREREPGRITIRRWSSDNKRRKVQEGEGEVEGGESRGQQKKRRFDCEKFQNNKKDNFTTNRQTFLKKGEGGQRGNQRLSQTEKLGAPTPQVGLRFAP